MSEDRPMSTGELDLDAALRDLGGWLATPATVATSAPLGTRAAPAIAERVRARIETDHPRRAAIPWWLALRGRGRSGPRYRRSLLLAAAALLLVAAAVSAAIGYGLPGIRILFGPAPTISPSTPGPTDRPSLPPGQTMGLGDPRTLDEARELMPFEILLPADPAIGPPEAVYVANRRLALAWGPDDALPGTTEPGLGLLLIELRANVDERMIEKMINTGTHVEPITVRGAPGYWVDGSRHFFAYLAPDGSRIEDSFREVGNTLVWTRDGVTYRLEAQLTRDEAIALAEGLR